MNRRNRYQSMIGIQTLFMVLFFGLMLTTSAMAKEKYAEGSRYIHQLNRQIIETTLGDGFSPPVASRIYAYANLAAYQASCSGFQGFKTLDGQLNIISGMPVADPKLEYDWRVSSITAIGGVASKMVYYYRSVDSVSALILNELQSTTSPEVFERSKEFGQQVVAALMTYVKVDGFVKIQASAKFDFPKDIDSVWEPTPPTFMDPADPFIATVRTLSMSSAGALDPGAPIEFSTDPKSAFYKQAQEVYQISQNMTDEQRAIALFWNDTPGSTEFIGHFMPTQRQINPGGHWINITRIVCEQRNLGLMETIEAYALVSVSMFDGFLSCWSAKYKYNTIRPVSYINRYFLNDLTDHASWKPLIQTPSFPEYPSGHSTISAAAATVLTKLFGPMAYTDDTETPFGYPARSFNNFMDAAQEASVSRVYGGIHFREGCDAGNRLGQMVGNNVMQKLVTRAS